MGFYLVAPDGPNRWRPIAYTTGKPEILRIMALKEEENPHADLLLLEEVKL